MIDRYESEMHCLDYCIKKAEFHYKNKEFNKVILFLENAKRSAEVLQSFEKTEEPISEEWLKKKQVEGARQMADRLIAAMRLGQ